MNYLEPNGGASFRDTVPYPNDIPMEREGFYTDPTAVPEIEEAIEKGYKDQLALRYAQFIREKMYGVDVRESISRFGLWLDVRTNSVEAKGSQINLEYNKIKKELEDFREQFELITSSNTIDGEVKLARHSLFSGKTYPSLKARLDFMESEHYLSVAGEINTARTLLDDNFSKNHTTRKVGSIADPTINYPIIIATVDDNKQDRFKLVKVGVI